MANIVVMFYVLDCFGGYNRTITPESYHVEPHCPPGDSLEHLEFNVGGLRSFGGRLDAVETSARLDLFKGKMRFG